MGFWKISHVNDENIFIIVKLQKLLHKNSELKASSFTKAFNSMGFKKKKNVIIETEFIYRIVSFSKFRFSNWAVR